MDDVGDGKIPAAGQSVNGVLEKGKAEVRHLEKQTKYLLTDHPDRQIDHDGKIFFQIMHIGDCRLHQVVG